MSVEASNFILTYSWTSTVWLAVTEAVNEVGLWDVGVNRAMWGAVIETVYGAVFWAVKEDSAPPALQDFLCPIEVET